MALRRGIHYTHRSPLHLGAGVTAQRFRAQRVRRTWQMATPSRGRRRQSRPPPSGWSLPRPAPIRRMPDTADLTDLPSQPCGSRPGGRQPVGVLPRRSRRRLGGVLRCATAPIRTPICAYTKLLPHAWCPQARLRALRSLRLEIVRRHACPHRSARRIRIPISAFRSRATTSAIIAAVTSSLSSFWHA